MSVPSTSHPSVAVVILNYNGRSILEQFLPSVTQFTPSNYRIIVADNGSLDASISFVKSTYPNLELIELAQNYGFAGGYNEALKQVETDYYVLLNSDVEVTENWIEPLVEVMKNDASIAAIQPKILAQKNKSNFEHAGAAGGYFDNLGYPFCRGRIIDFCEEDQGQYDTTQEIFWASGAAMLVRANLYHQLGGLDADYFAHMEEIDLCWRMKRAGFRILCVPTSKVYHVGGGTLAYDSPNKVYLNFRNSLTTLFKNEASLKLIWLFPLRLILDGMAGGLFLVQGKLSNIWAIIRAHFSFYGQFFSTLKKRKQTKILIQKVKIGKPNLEGLYKGSIIINYYLRKIKKFSTMNSFK